VAKICQMCGMSNIDTTGFCSACGSSLSGTENAQEKERPSVDDKARTVLGMPAVGSDIPETKPSKPPMAAPTMATPSKPPMATVTQPAAPSQKPAEKDKRTVIGMAAVTLKAPMATPAQAVKSVQQDIPQDKRTVLGIPTIASSTPPREDQDRLETAKVKERATRDQKEPEEADRKGKEDQSWRRSPAGRKTPLDLPRVQGVRQPHIQKSEHDDWPDEETGRRVQGSGLFIATIVAAIIVIVGIVFVYVFVLESDLSLTPQVFNTADGKAVTVVFAFPKAPPGSSIQVAGKTVPIASGQASLEIQLSDLHLGVNDLQAVYQEPGDRPENKSFSIILRHSVTTDLSGLAAQEPFVVVDFKIAQGIALAVEGKPVKLTEGSYLHRIGLDQIPASAKTMSDNLIHQVSFQLIDSEGAVEQGQHVVAVPLTKLQIDRPADKAVVANDSVTCAGTTEDGAEVTVNGEPVGVTVAGFLTSVPLSSLGEHEIQVTARAPGKAPNIQSVSVSRLESLERAVDDWSKDLDKRLDYPTIGRDPNAHANKKVKLSGTIANIKTEKGVTAMLLYIADSCPKGNLCAVYVVFRGETEAGLHSWVDVYGRVKGTRTIDLQSGKRDVPYIDAEFVVEGERTKKTG
jgi:hypothetical protein